MGMWERFERRTFRCLSDTLAITVFLSFQHLVQIPFVCNTLELLKALREHLFAFYLRHF
jgi:hypothetical protein